MSDIYYPAQVHGISKAVSMLEKYKETDDEMVHIWMLQDGSGAVMVQLTNPSKTYYVTEHGRVCGSRKELEDVITKAEKEAAWYVTEHGRVCGSRKELEDVITKAEKEALSKR